MPIKWVILVVFCEADDYRLRRTLRSLTDLISDRSEGMLVQSGRHIPDASLTEVGNDSHKDKLYKQSDDLASAASRTAGKMKTIGIIGRIERLGNG